MGKSTKIEKELVSASKVFLDTAIFIYFLKENKRWIDLVLPIFELAEEKKVKIITSHITALEVLTGYKKAKKEELVSNFWQMLEDFDIELLTFHKRNHVEKAAQLRSDFNIRTPDAIQLSLAINEKIPCFVTNDAKLKAIKELKILCLKDYIA